METNNNFNCPFCICLYKIEVKHYNVICITLMFIQNYNYVDLQYIDHDSMYFETQWLCAMLCVCTYVRAPSGCAVYVLV